MTKNTEININKLLIEKKVNVNINYSVLTHLYLPIIGNKALNSYLWLDAEANFLLQENVSSSLSRLASYIDVSKQDLVKKIFQKLEGVSLITTYLDIEKEYYLVQVKPPLSFSSFFKNTYLKELTKSKLPFKHWERTIALFKKENIIPENALNVSYSFDSFFKSEMRRKPSWAKQDIISKTMEFDIDLVKARLGEANQITINLTKRVKKQISFLSKLYSFHIGEVTDIIKYCQNQYEKINVSNITKAFADIYEQKIKNVQRNFFDIDISKTVLAFFSPINFILEYEDRPASSDEIDLIQKLQIKFKFSSEIINMLLHYSLIKNRKIVPNYIIKIGETLYKNSISTPKMVAQHLRIAYNTTLRIKKPNKKKNVPNDEVEDNVSDLFNSFLGKK